MGTQPARALRILFSAFSVLLLVMLIGCGGGTDGTGGRAISGTVKARATAAPIPNATVTDLATGASDVTDQDGKFFFETTKRIDSEPKAALEATEQLNFLLTIPPGEGTNFEAIEDTYAIKVPVTAVSVVQEVIVDLETGNVTSVRVLASDPAEEALEEVPPVREAGEGGASSGGGGGGGGPAAGQAPDGFKPEGGGVGNIPNAPFPDGGGSTDAGGGGITTGGGGGGGGRR